MPLFEREKRISTTGCLTTAVGWFKSYLITIGIVSFGILLLQIITIWLATTLRGQVTYIKSTFPSDKVNGSQAFRLNAPISSVTCIMRFDITNLALYSETFVYSYDIVGDTKI